MVYVDESITGSTDSNGFSLTVRAYGTISDTDGSGTLNLRATLNSTNNNFTQWTINSSIVETNASPNITITTNSVQRTIAKNSTLLVAQGTFSVAARTGSRSLRFVGLSDGSGTASYIPNNTTAALSITLAAPTPPVVAPTAPTSVSATTTRTDGINVTWSGSSGTITSYGIWWGSSVSNAPTDANSDDFTVTTSSSSGSYLDTTMPQGTSRWYWVRAYNGTAKSSWSSVSNAGLRYSPVPAPGAPTGLYVSNNTNSRLTLNWNSSSGTVNGYSVYLNGSLQSSLGSSSTSFTFTGLAANTTYTLGVLAYGPDASSSTSSVTGTTLPNTFTVPNVVGQTQAVGTNTLTNAGFGSVSATLVTSGATSSNNLLIISQSPVSGTSAISGDAATINVYNYLLQVPSILGQTESQALTTLSNAGFLTRSSSQVTSGATVANNRTVAAQNPTGGTQYNPAYNIAFTIYNFLTAVPNVVGQQLDTAITSLSNLGFVSVTTTLDQVGATAQNVNTVKSQTPVNSATTYNPKDQSVALVVYSLGVTGKRYNGTSYQALTTAKRYNGTSWVQLTVAKRFDGTQWKDITN